MNLEKKYFHIYSTSSKEGFWDTYVAVDSEGWSVRFVQIAEDGTPSLATELVQIGDTVLPESPIKGDEVAEGYQLDDIGPKEFEKAWEQAVKYARDNKLAVQLTGVIYN